MQILEIKWIIERHQTVCKYTPFIRTTFLSRPVSTGYHWLTHAQWLGISYLSLDAQLGPYLAIHKVVNWIIPLGETCTWLYVLCCIPIHVVIITLSSKNVLCNMLYWCTIISSSSCLFQVFLNGVYILGEVSFWISIACGI